MENVNVYAGQGNPFEQHVGILSVGRPFSNRYFRRRYLHGTHARPTCSFRAHNLPRRWDLWTPHGIITHILRYHRGVYRI